MSFPTEDIRHPQYIARRDHRHHALLFVIAFLYQSDLAGMQAMNPLDGSSLLEELLSLRKLLTDFSWCYGLLSIIRASVLDCSIQERAVNAFRRFDSIHEDISRHK